MGTGAERGTIIIFGAMILTMEPIRKDDFIVAAGTTGKVARDCELIVRLRPATINTKDNSIEIPGPLIATSKKAFLVGGNDLKGVIEPKLPTCNDGRGTGNPNFTPFIFAATKCPASCSAEIARTPKKIGRQAGTTADTSFSFTTELKKAGLSAKQLMAYANVVKKVSDVDKAARDLVARPRSDSCSGSTSLARAIITDGVFSLSNDGRHSKSSTRNNLTRSLSSGWFSSFCCI
mmetsp:Transcript_16568/g.34971  ORF Transcript_16568/g.34971 Transcript_16568/m.34971 type:complete len:234 (+) Transcript_16568:1942-2643(+)